jgi:hypothetical protein
MPVTSQSLAATLRSLSASLSDVTYLVRGPSEYGLDEDDAAKRDSAAAGFDLAADLLDAGRADEAYDALDAIRLPDWAIDERDARDAVMELAGRWTPPDRDGAIATAESVL